MGIRLAGLEEVGGISLSGIIDLLETRLAALEEVGGTVHDIVLEQPGLRLGREYCELGLHALEDVRGISLFGIIDVLATRLDFRLCHKTDFYILTLILKQHAMLSPFQSETPSRFMWGIVFNPIFVDNYMMITCDFRLIGMLL